MAVTFAGTNAVITTDVPEFIPELWSDEVLAAYKANLVMANLVTQMPFSGSKGDTVHVPKPTRGSATAKAASNAVTLIVGADDVFNLSINQHWEYSRLIEDIVKIQALDTLRQFYTDDAGYSLAVRIDTDLHSQGAKFSGGDAAPDVAGTAYSKAFVGSVSGGELVTWDPAANATAGNAGSTSLTDEVIRIAMRYLDVTNVPARFRQWVVSPFEKQRLLGVARFTEQAYTGEVGGSNTIRNGMIGNLYGVPVYVSTQTAAVAAGDASVDQQACLLFQKEAIVHAEQMSPRTQTQYKQEFLADLLTADVIYGDGTPRSGSGVAIITDA